MRDEFKTATDNPAIRALMSLLDKSHAEYMREKEEQIALCKRVGEQIDSVHAITFVVEG